MKHKVLILALLLISAALTVGLFVPRVKGIIWIEGHITQDTTWTPIDVYRVINNTYVDAGVTLTIEPGVEVQFADGFSLIAQGSLNATGTNADPIIFTSSRATPSLGAWNTIKFEGNLSEQMFLKNVKVEYAVYGVSIQSLAPAVIEKSEIVNCSESGIMLVGQSNVLIKENIIEQNKNGIATDGSNIHRGISVTGNTISSNQQNGIYLYSSSDIYNVTVSSNTVSSNRGNGIYLDSYGYGYRGGYGYSDIYNVTVSSNTVSSNEDSGVYLKGKNHNTQLVYDIAILANMISANYQTAISIDGGINANISRNSVSYNKYGVFHTTTKNNRANYNDIYRNTYGMNVTNGATVNAEYNYWGHSTGPYHASLNPEGKGNSVNGDGTDLDFIPFLSAPIGHINERPVPYLEVDGKKENVTLIVNQTYTFDASGSTDDGRIDYYFFDFGDGTNSGWTPLPIVFHKYASEGTYNATIIVMDDFGVTSLDGNLVYVEIRVIPEFPSALILPLLMIVTLIVVVLRKTIWTKRRKE